MDEQRHALKQIINITEQHTNALKALHKQQEEQLNKKHVDYLRFENKMLKQYINIITDLHEHRNETFNELLNAHSIPFIEGLELMKQEHKYEHERLTDVYDTERDELLKIID